MATNGTVKIIVAILSLTFPITAFTDYLYRPTAGPQAGPQLSDTSPNNRFPASFNETVSRRQRLHADDTIVYPDAHLKPSCTHGLCVNVAGYPRDQIQKLLSRSHVMSGYFEASEEFVTLNNRFNTDEMSLCETKVHTIYPEKANNTMRVEKVIVNVEGHKQGIVFETCVSRDDGPCKFSSNFPTGYRSFCKQKYIHKRLMVLGDNDKFVFDSFEVPSCCVCTVTRTD